MKSLQTIPWSTRLWKRRDRVAGSLLLTAASLLSGDVGLMPTFAGEEAAGVSSVTPLEQLGQESAQERWERLKSRYQPMVSTQDSAAPARMPVTAAHGALRGSALPVPEDDSPYRRESQQNAAAPLPIGVDEPAWIIAAPMPAAAAELQEPVPVAVPRTLQVPQPAAVQRVAQATESDSVTRPAAPAGGETADPALKPAESPGSMPSGAPVNRAVRKISQIQPYYDKMVDEDIREYADERAADYGLSFGNETYVPRVFPDTAMAWEPTDYYHYPLYFEDPALERYGHTYPAPIQPFVSVARFSGQLLAIPYQMTLDPPTRQVYALGWYRPGEVAPKLKYQIPLNAQAAAVQAGVTTGMFFLIP